PKIPFKAVHASRGKVVRAQPVAQIYEEGRGHHVGSFAKLEDQMAEFTIDFDRDAFGYSPDRVDALVWALTDLLVTPMKGEGIFELYRQQAAAITAAKAQREEKPAPMPQPASMEWFAMMLSVQGSGRRLGSGPSLRRDAASDRGDPTPRRRLRRQRAVV